MHYKYVIIVLALLIGQNVAAQFRTNPKDAETILHERKEVFFRFDSGVSDALLDKASELISIDSQSEDDWIYAYASRKGFEAFKALGVEYTLLYNPSELAKPKMWAPDARSTYEWDEYPTYEGYVDMMEQFEVDYPGLCTVENIGTTIEGRELLVARISDNVDSNENEPEFFYTSTMHGDETAGYVLMLRYIDHLLSNYGSNDRITNLVDNMEIYINPNANPDGTYATGNSSVTGATRGNANGIDLNRNFPDPEDGEHPDGNAWQPETIAFMDFAEDHDFVMSANFHGGAEVINYPWDTWPDLHADDEWYQFISHEYADTAQLHSPAGYMNSFNDGITNGYSWYSISGGRQDYMNYFHSCREVTIELSDVKLIPESELENHWEYNYRSLLNYMEQATYGIRGVVTDGETGNAVEAEVVIEGHDQDNSAVFSSLPVGNYYRLIKAGTYDLTFYSECHETETIEGISIEDYNAVVQDIELTSLGFSPGFTASSTNILIGSEVEFIDETCGNPTSWEWTFEGGTPATSNEQNPVVVYEDPGTYDVTLTVSNGTDEETITEEDYITASAEFTMTNQTVSTCQGLFYDDGGPDGNYSDGTDLTMTFTPATDEFLTVEFLSFNVEDHENCSYDWLKIYDGESTSADLIGTYCGTESPGTITATNSSGALTFQFHSDNNVNEPGWEAQISCSGGMLPPEAEFEASQTNIVEGESVEFTDMSSNNPTSWSWTFEGGTPAISNQQNPTVTYNEPGDYNVQLVATNEAGSDTETKESFISVGVNTASDMDQLSNTLSVYPNPAHSDYIHINSPEKINKIEVINITGKVINTLFLNTAKHRLSVAELENGLYVLRFFSEANTTTRKVQILR